MSANTLPRHDFPSVPQEATGLPKESLWNWIFNRKPQPVKVQSLAAKLAEVCEAVGGVPKEGHNQVDGYHYQRWRDISRAIRGEFSKRGLTLVPGEATVVSALDVLVENKKHEKVPGVRLTLQRRYDITDGLQTMSFWGIGVGEDVKDKALQKADTGALKYGLRDMFLIPDVEDDPEEVADASEKAIKQALTLDEQLDAADREVSKTRPDLEKKIAAVKKQDAESEIEISAKAIRAWNSLCKNHGKTVRQRRDYLMASFGVKAITEVKLKVDYDRAIVWASNREEIGKTLDASLAATKIGPQPVVAEIEREREDESLTGD
jgi:hypothetical protein